MSKIKVHFDELVFSFVFKGMPDIVPEDILAEKLEALGFEINRGERMFKLPVGEVVIPNFARKGGIDLVYDPRESFIGIGTKTGDLGILQNHVENVLKKILEELEIQADVTFYRIVSRGRAWYGKDTKDVLKKVVKVEGLSDIENLINLDMKLQPMTLRLIPADKTFKEFPWVDIIVEPLVVNPKYYHHALTYVDIDYEKCITLLSNLSDLVSRLLEHIGGDNI